MFALGPGPKFPARPHLERTARAHITFLGFGRQTQVDVLEAGTPDLQRGQADPPLQGPAGQLVERLHGAVRVQRDLPVGERRLGGRSRGGAHGGRKLIEREPVREAEPDLDRLAVAGELVGRPLGDDPATGDDRHPVGELLRLLHVVGGEEDRLAQLTQAGDHPPRLAARGGVEPCCGLV